MPKSQCKVMLACLPLIALMLPVSCQWNSAGSVLKIVGGSDMAQATDQRALNATVSLYSGEPDNGETCSGTLIGPKQIVTAAHCVKGFTAMHVGYGMTSPGPDMAIRVTGFTAHPKWASGTNPSYLYDIGVISFEGNLPSNMQPVALAAPDALKAGMNLLLAGYGLTAQDNNGSWGTLREVVVTTDNVDTQKRILGITTNTGKGGCNGDSGGPAFIDDNGTLKLVGATHGPSLTMENVKCDAGHGTWTMVNLYQGWMKCAFAAENSSLDSLGDDDSSSDCQAADTTHSQPNNASDMIWCDSYHADKCFPYCTTSADTGGGFGYQDDLGGSCKIR